jgi:gamma-glutamyltranspeptidase/glutathione hydrolase
LVFLKKEGVMVARYISILGALLCITACQHQTAMHSNLSVIPKEVIIPEIATGREVKPVVQSKQFMVVAAHPLAVKAGQKILSQGGSSIDAAIAVQAVLNVVEPQSSGLGGGGFLVHYDAQTKNMIAYDGREVAPENVKPNLFIADNGLPMAFDKASTGGGAVAVPSVLKMLSLAHKEQGKLPWDALFQDAIHIAKNGYPLSKRLHLMLKVASHYRELSETDFKRYLNADSTVKAIGDIIYNKPLSHTFTKIAKNGADIFYNGDIANDIIDTVTTSTHFPSVMTLNDLATYQPKKRAVPCINYHNHTICGMAPPSSGGVTVMQAVKMLERFNLKNYDYYNPYHIHLTASALRLAFADRNKYLADPDFIAVPTKALLGETYLRQRSELIDSKKAFDKAVAGDPSEATTQFASLKTTEPPSTTHMSIVDADGDAVSFTSTVEQAFGSGLVTKSGFILNNQMTDFDFMPEKDGIKVANSVEAGKRPRSSMAPFLVFNPNGQLMGVIGSPGGARIISFVLPRILSMIHSDMPISAMLSAPNMTAMLPDPIIELEKGVDLKNLDNELIKYGYSPVIRDLTSGIHMIYIKDGILYGTADPRREGRALGE